MDSKLSNFNTNILTYLIFFVSFTVLKLDHDVHLFKQEFTLFALVPSRTTRKIGLKSPQRSVAIPPMVSSFPVIPRKHLPRASNTNFLLIGVSSIMTV